MSSMCETRLGGNKKQERFSGRSCMYRKILNRVYRFTRAFPDQMLQI